MAEITITIPDEYVSDGLDAFAHQFNYDQTKNANESKAIFAKRMVIDNMKKIVKNYIAIRAAEIAKIEASKDIDIMIL